MSTYWLGREGGERGLSVRETMQKALAALEELDPNSKEHCNFGPRQKSAIWALKAKLALPLSEPVTPLLAEQRGEPS